MAKASWCRHCRVEVEPVGLADGTLALICLDCDLIGLEHEMRRGAAMWPAGLRAPAPGDPAAHADEDEDLEPRAFAVATIRQMIAAREIIDLKTVAGLTLIGAS